MTQRSRILLIDDDRDFVEATSLVLASAYDVDVAYDGQVGLSQARQTRPDLIILDVIMPGGDGFQVCDQIRADPILSEVPVIFLTSLPSGLDLPDLVGEPCHGDYLEKPVRPAELLKRVQQLLEG